MSRVAYAVAFALFLVKEVLVSAVDVGRDALTPGLSMHPGVAKLPLRCSTDVEVTLLASSITVTPGTLTVGIASPTATEPGALFVHAVYGTDREQVLRDLRAMETRLLRMTRGAAGARSAGYLTAHGEEVAP